MSAVRPRPVGPTIRGKAFATTTPSLPRMRRHVSPNEVISITAIVAAHGPRRGQRTRSQDKKKRGVPAQLAPLVPREGEGTEKRCFAVPLTFTVVGPRKGPRGQSVKKHTSFPETGLNHSAGRMPS